DDRIARAAAGGMKAPTRAADAPDAPSPPLVFFKDKQEFRFPADTVLFFETDGGDVYAHTANDAFQVRERLYELSDILPPSFLRVSKSAILNAHKVYSIQRNLTASSRVEFEGSHKVLYVSRFYYKALHKYLDSH
ncbi:MAG: LytTR family transcriptional regulator, partial [Oscillospiraceae bacterium]|nr:LytTR family transcriptional regulator [Oscillospiraceae bacterium]